ncbi:MAG: DNA repair exonuclease [Gemmataceae bacterium]|nr:DNA repair exonuclease [Gemmataceae bacterium]
MIRFLHAADIHLDSCQRGLEPYEGAPIDSVFQATRKAFVRLVDLALAEKVDFVAIAGDLYDGDWHDWNSGLFLARELARLHDSQIPVVWIAGNHDAANKMTKSLRLPERIRMLRCDSPESFELPDVGVVIHGQGFGQQAVTDDLSLRYPAARKGWFNVGLLHTSATGREGHEPYAPCKTQGLLSRGYDYWALGHVHTREVLCEETPIIFPGNTQGRHFREIGPRGCMLVEAEGPGKVRCSFRPLDVFRWDLAEVDVEGFQDFDAFLDSTLVAVEKLRSLHQMPLAIRLRAIGSTDLCDRLVSDPLRWTNEIRVKLKFAGYEDVWLERILLNVHPGSRLQSVPKDGPIGELFRILEDYQKNPEALAECVRGWREVQELSRKLPADLQTSDLLLGNPDWLLARLAHVKPLLIRRLLHREGRA